MALTVFPNNVLSPRESSLLNSSFLPCAGGESFLSEVVTKKMVRARTEAFTQAVGQRTALSKVLGKLSRLSPSDTKVREEVRKACVKTRGYFLRFFSGESWSEWTENRTALGKVVTAFQDCLDSSVNAGCLTKRFNEKLLGEAEREAEALLGRVDALMGKHRRERNDGSFSCVSRVVAGAIGSGITGHPAPLLVGLGSCLPGADAQIAVGDGFPLPAQTETHGAAESYSFAGLSNGNFLLTRVVCDNCAFGVFGQNSVTKINIYGQLYDSCGAQVGNEFLMFNAPNNDLGWQVVLNNQTLSQGISGGCFIAQLVNVNEEIVSSQLFSPIGAKIGNETLANSLPHTIALGVGNTLVVWGSTGNYSLQLYNISGDMEGAKILSSSFPFFTTLGKDNFGIWWGDSESYYLQVYDAKGNAIVNEIQSSSKPSAYPFDSGNFYISWQRIEGYNEVFYLQVYDVSGNAIVTEIPSSSKPSAWPFDNGKFCISWQGIEGYIEDFYLQVYNANGGMIGGAILVPSNPSFYALNNGNFYISWQGIGGYYYLQLYNASGIAIGTEQLSIWPAVNLLDNGNFYITLQKGEGYILQPYDGYISQGGGGYSLQLFDASGSAIGPAIQSSSWPLIYWYDNTNFYIGWQDDEGYALQLFDANGSAIGPAIQSSNQPQLNWINNNNFYITSQVGSIFYLQIYSANSSAIGSAIPTPSFATASPLDNGSFYIAWLGNEGYNLQLYSASVSAIGPVIQASYAHSVNPLGNGNFYIASQTGEGYTLQLYNASGNTIGFGIPLSFWPTFSLLDNGNFCVSGYGSGNYSFQVYKANGSPVSSAIETEISYFSYPYLWPLANGNFFIAWQDSESFLEGCNFQSYNTSGSAINSRIQTPCFPYAYSLANDNFYIMWESGVYYYLQIYNAKGSTVNAEIQGISYWPLISQLDNGSFYITWENVDGTYYLQLYNASANAIGSTQSFLLPSVTQLRNGNFYIQWIENGIYYLQMHDAYGSTVGTILSFSSSNYTNIIEPSIDSWMVHWNDSLGLNVFQMYNITNYNLGELLPIQSPSAYPGIIALTNGNFIFQWKDQVRQIYRLQIFSLSNNANITYNETQVQSATPPSTFASGGGNFAIQRQDNPPPSYLYDSLVPWVNAETYLYHLQLYDENGSPVGNEISSFYPPGATNTTNNNTLIWWWDQGYRFQLFDVTGTQIGDPIVISAIPNDATITNFEVVAAINSDDFVVTWQYTQSGYFHPGFGAQLYSMSPNGTCNASAVLQGSGGDWVFNYNGYVYPGILTFLSLLGVPATLLAATKVGVDQASMRNLQKALEEGAAQAGEDRALFYNQLVVPLALRLFGELKTTNFAGYRGKARAVAMLNAIQILARKLEQLPIRGMAANPESRFLKVVVEKVIEVTLPNRNALAALIFKPSVHTAILEQHAEAIAQAVQESLAPASRASRGPIERRESKARVERKTSGLLRVTVQPATGQRSINS